MIDNALFASASIFHSMSGKPSLSLQNLQPLIELVPQGHSTDQASKQMNETDVPPTVSGSSARIVPTVGTVGGAPISVGAAPKSERLWKLFEEQHAAGHGRKNSKKVLVRTGMRNKDAMSDPTGGGGRIPSSRFGRRGERQVFIQTSATEGLGGLGLPLSLSNVEGNNSFQPFSSKDQAPYHDSQTLSLDTDLTGMLPLQENTFLEVPLGMEMMSMASMAPIAPMAMASSQPDDIAKRAAHIFAHNSLKKALIFFSYESLSEPIFVDAALRAFGQASIKGYGQASYASGHASGGQSSKS